MIDGRLRARTVNVLITPSVPGLVTRTLIFVFTRSERRTNGLSETVPERADVIALRAQPFEHVTLHRRAACGTPFTDSVVKRELVRPSRLNP